VTQKQTHTVESGKPGFTVPDRRILIEKNNTKGVDKLVAGGGHWASCRVAYPATKNSPLSYFQYHISYTTGVKIEHIDQ